MSLDAGGKVDPTRKERREQARVERKALEEAHASAVARRKRLIQLGSILGAVVVIIAVILIATSGGDKKSTPPTGAGKSTVIREISSLLGGIHQAGNVLGNPDAPATMQEFADLECTYCQQYTLEVLPSLVSKYVRAGKVKVEYRSLETATRNPSVFQEQQTAALAAGKQNLMWYYVELFYHEQGQEDSGYVTPSYLEGIANQIPGLNKEKWNTDRQEPALANQVLNDERAAAQLGFTGTPSFLLGKTGSTLQKFEPPSLTEPSAFEAAINKLFD